jgi:hypothetical protein
VKYLACLESQHLTDRKNGAELEPTEGGAASITPRRLSVRHKSRPCAAGALALHDIQSGTFMVVVHFVEVLMEVLHDVIDEYPYLGRQILAGLICNVD